MSQYLYRKYFEIVPVNNISVFKVNNGTNQISFLVPPVAGATMQTHDLLFNGTITIKKADGTPYTQADMANTDISMDSVNGFHNMISRVDISSQGSGNALIEQRLQYPLITKYRRGVLAKNDLAAGKHNVQSLCSTNSAGARNWLTSNNNVGHDFAVQLNTGFLKDNIQQINLGAANGILIKIYLSEVANALFSVNPNAASKLTADFNIEISNAKLFGRYNYATAPVLNSLTGVQFRKITDIISVVQSSNDTLAVSPMVNSLHKIVNIYQPNSTTANNVDQNNTQTNQIVGLKKYAISNNGSRHPYNYDIDITPSISELVPTDGDQGRVSGNAEQCYFFISALNSQYPPVHSLVNAENQAIGYEDIETDVNSQTLNVNGIAVDYSYGFTGFSVPMTNNLLQFNVESSVLTNDPIVPTSSRDQTQTQNSFAEYDAMLQYAGMTVSQ